ncbi:hypothetical protein HJG60_011358 [Phyllostomus discolor]|uniref:Uncharacterized protein n=1 Tax=Phyllostomus discolor TaxID=89673 RepID=A0A833ZWQ2_9CHIR|nr:hypothetical protein HJG60_011358 [Phyllostomus discolor]
METIRGLQCGIPETSDSKAFASRKGQLHRFRNKLGILSSPSSQERCSLFCICFFSCKNTSHIRLKFTLSICHHFSQIACARNLFPNKVTFTGRKAVCFDHFFGFQNPMTSYNLPRCALSSGRLCSMDCIR